MEHTIATAARPGYLNLCPSSGVSLSLSLSLSPSLAGLEKRRTGVRLAAATTQQIGPTLHLVAQGPLGRPASMVAWPLAIGISGIRGHRAASSCKPAALPCRPRWPPGPCRVNAAPRLSLSCPHGCMEGHPPLAPIRTRPGVPICTGGRLRQRAWDHAADGGQSWPPYCRMSAACLDAPPTTSKFWNEAWSRLASSTLPRAFATSWWPRTRRCHGPCWRGRGQMHPGDRHQLRGPPGWSRCCCRHSASGVPRCCRESADHGERWSNLCHARLHARFFPGKRHGATAREETTSGHPGPSSKIQPFTADADHQVACPALASAVPLPPPPPPPPSPSPACLASDRRTAGWQGETRGASLT